MRVIEFGGLAAGFCGRLFAHTGADVVRVEGATAPVTDAWVSQRAVDTFLHAGKRRVSFVDYAMLQRLISAADVVVAEGMPDELEALGWESLEGIRVAITPFGMTGPRRQWHASASVLLAMGGQTYLMGDPGRAPLTLPGHYTEYQSGQYAYIAAAASFFGRSVSSGCSIDVSMLETLLSLSQMTTVMWTFNGKVRSRHGSHFGVISPVNMFPCTDGWFHVTATSSFWGPLTEMMGLPELENDPRFATAAARIDNKDELDRLIFECLGHKTKAEVQRLGKSARVPTGILQELDEVLVDPHLSERDFWCLVDGMKSPSLGFRFQGDPTKRFRLENIDD